MGHLCKKNLDEVVKEALELHASHKRPDLKSILGEANRRLVIASGNALPTGKIIFSDEDAVFANESQYESSLAKHSGIDSIVVISASGEKHAPVIINSLLKARGKKRALHLLTCDAHSTAASMLDPEHVVATVKREEPTTYNTSTYLGMILSRTQEDPETILRFIEDEIDPVLESMERMFSDFDSFFILVGEDYNYQREMFTTKFDELFGPKLNGRCFTFPQTMHARTVVQSESELFISIEADNHIFGFENARLNLPRFPHAGQAAVVAIGYYVIGKIQSQFEPWFLNSIDSYAGRQVEWFDTLRHKSMKEGQQQ